MYRARFTMRKYFHHMNLLIFPLLFFALLFAWMVEAGAAGREVVEGDSVAVITLKDTAGNRHRIPAESGMTVVLFWATWSKRSAQAIDLWERFVIDYPDEPFRVVSVASEKDEISEEDVRAIAAYIRENQVSMPVVLDENLELFNSYGVKALPTVFMLDSDGLILYRYPGFPASASLDLREELEVQLRLKDTKTAEESAAEAGLAYRPENNALLFFKMGNVFEEKGLLERAVDKYVEALVKDSEYEDPLRALERIYFRDGRTPGAEESLKARLSDGGLGDLVDRVTEAGKAGGEEEKGNKAPDEERSLSPMERMRLLMENKGSEE
jgi:hypothetical protein